MGCTGFTPLRICLSVYIDPVGVGQSPFHAIVVRGTAAKADSGVVVDEVLQNAYLYTQVGIISCCAVRSQHDRTRSAGATRECGASRSWHCICSDVYMTRA